MKKFVFTGLFLLLSNYAMATTISISPFVSNNDVTISALETQRTTIQNWANGNIDGTSNIIAGGIVSANEAV